MKGSIYQRKGSGPWYLSIDVGMEPDENGKLKRVRHQWTFQTKREAEETRIAKLAELQQGTYSGPSKKRVAEWLDEWLATKVNLASTTRAGYVRDIKRINKVLGPRKLVDLTPTMINRFYVQLSETLGAKTIQNTHGVLYSALRAAVDRDVITRNPAARGIELPKVERPEIEVWTLDELKAFLQHAASHQLYPAIVLTISSGLRRSETLGLRWQNVDLEVGTASIRDTLVPVDGSVEHRIDVTKSKKSRRVIALDEQTVAVLRAHRKRQAIKKMASPIWHDLDLVFTNEIGQPIRPTTFSRTWKRLATEADVTPLTPHPAARHGWASLALQNGIPIKVVQEQLGHASLGITSDIYSHVSEDLARDAVEKVMAAVWLQK